MKKPAQRTARKAPAKAKAQAKAQAKAKTKAKANKPKPSAKAGSRPKPRKSPTRAAKPTPSRRAGSRHKPATDGTQWQAFVEQHGVVLASARGPVPSVASAIAGEPIVGSWWAHAKAQVIFDALSSIDDSDDIRCFKLVDNKITFVHRRLWPALARLAQAGILVRARVEAIQQEHMPTGEHRNFTIPFPEWVPDDVLARAERLGIDDARAQLGNVI
ncbi:MAG: hypothetical protein WKG01_10430 [Kofleriaceae bacterium]